MRIVLIPRWTRSIIIHLTTSRAFSRLIITRFLSSPHRLYSIICPIRAHIQTPCGLYLVPVLCLLFSSFRTKRLYYPLYPVVPAANMGLISQCFSYHLRLVTIASPSGCHWKHPSLTPPPIPSSPFVLSGTLTALLYDLALVRQSQNVPIHPSWRKWPLDLTGSATSDVLLCSSLDYYIIRVCSPCGELRVLLIHLVCCLGHARSSFSQHFFKSPFFACCRTFRIVWYLSSGHWYITLIGIHSSLPLILIIVAFMTVLTSLSVFSRFSRFFFCFYRHLLRRTHLLFRQHTYRQKHKNSLHLLFRLRFILFFHPCRVCSL